MMGVALGLAFPSNVVNKSGGGVSGSAGGGGGGNVLRIPNFNYVDEVNDFMWHAQVSLKVGSSVSYTDDETAVLVQNAVWDDISLDVPTVVIGKTYRITYPSGSPWIVQFRTADGDWVWGVNEGDFVMSGTTFTVPPDTGYMKLLGTGGSQLGTFTFKLPTITEIVA